MSGPQKPPRVIHTLDGWVIETDTALSPDAVLACCKHVLRTHLPKVNRMPNSDKKESLLRALAQLDPATIKQRLRPAYAWEREAHLVKE